MVRTRVAAAVGAGLVFYALGDVLLWQRIFEAHGLYQYDAVYQTGHREILLALIVVGMVLLFDTGWWAIGYALALYTLAWGGAADVLYYWLDGRPLPAVLPWLDENRLIPLHPVTSATLLLSVALWLGLWLASLWAAGRLSISQPAHSS